MKLDGTAARSLRTSRGCGEGLPTAASCQVIFNNVLTCELSESTSIPVNPRTNRPVGYAFVDLATAPEATAAIEALSGKEILARKVSVQLARKPEPAEAKDGAASGGEGASGAEGRKRSGGRGRGRGRARGRGGRTTRARGVSIITPASSFSSVTRRKSNYGYKMLTMDNSRLRRVKRPPKPTVPSRLR